jgi:hypothetical protein
LCQAATTLAGQSSCVACGSPSQPCCAATGMSAGTCLPGSTCQMSSGSYTYSCVACGGSGQACCTGNTCTTGTCKANGNCPS